MTSATSRGFTGHEMIDAACMINMNARVYDPSLGRFASADDRPSGSGNGQDWNTYAYVNNGPLSATDPTGHTPCFGCITYTISVFSQDTWKISSCSSFGGPCSSTIDIDSYANGYLRGLLGFGVPNSPGGRGPGGGGGGRADGKTHKPESPKPDDTNGKTCPVPPLTQAEKDDVARGDRAAFWQARLDGGNDPLAATALSMTKNSSLMAEYANGVLFNAISERSKGSMGLEQIKDEINQIGVQIMQGYAGLVQSGGAADPRAIATLHFDVFGRHGLPADTYGGSLFTGSADIAALAAPLYMTCH
ncbi:MAG TPA: RHS repeat-associated core domain-containing protein [Rhizomicrobium sp.]|nr:RHS repeat-associated core domain-containing protein [Rhizomicrobium sp.]